jgi:hypothetical protein
MAEIITSIENFDEESFLAMFRGLDDLDLMKAIAAVFQRLIETGTLNQKAFDALVAVMEHCQRLQARHAELGGKIQDLAKKVEAAED